MSLSKLVKSIIFSSKWFEGNPMTIIESYKNQLPVISPNVGNAKEMIKDGVTGLHFKTGDVESLISKIKELDDLDKSSLNDNAYKEFVNKYDQNIGYNNLMSIYCRLIEQK